MKLMVVDDDSFIRESLKLILSLEDGFDVVAACADGQEAYEELSRMKGEVDVVLMDIRMPGCDGVEGTRLIKQAFPKTSVLILTTFDDDAYIVRALQNGASGYLLKNISPNQIIEGIRTVRQGSMLIHPDIARKLPALLAASAAGESAADSAVQPGQTGKRKLIELGLTEAEQNVVRIVAEGKSNKEIAQELFLSEGTVKNQISVILSKLGLRDRTQLAIYYLTNCEE